MPEAKTEIVSLSISSSPWDSQYNTTPVIVNMITDTNERLLSIPVPLTLHTFLDYSTETPNDNVTQLAIIRAASSSAVYSSQLRINVFFADYAVITTQYKPAVDAEVCTITLFRIDEFSQEVLDVIPLDNDVDDGPPTINPNFMNRGDFSYAQNSNAQCAFIDDEALLWYFEIDTTTISPPKLVTYNGARFQYLSDSSWGVLGDVGSDHVAAGTDAIKETDITGNIDYHALLTNIPGNKQLIVILQNYGVVYDASQNLFFFTEAGDFSKILFQFEQWPIYNGSAASPYNPANWTTPDGQQGTPVTYPAPGRVVDMVGINSALFVFAQDSIYKFNLVMVNNNPTLQPDLTFNMHYRIRPNSNALLYQNAMYFVSDNDKMYVLTPKGKITELSNRLLPDRYYFLYNNFTVDTVFTQNYFPSRVLLPIKVFNMNCIMQNYTLLNLDTGNFSYLVPNQNLQIEWEAVPGFDCSYNQPKRITASSDTGRYVGMQNIFLYMPTEFDVGISSVSTNIDYFSSSLLITKRHTFQSKNKGTLAGISISFTDSLFDPSLYETYDAITLGIYLIVDNVISVELMDNLYNDTWWKQYDKTFNRSFSTNIFTAKYNISCQSFIVCLRLSNFTIPGDIAPQFELQKFATDNIMFNLME